MIKLNFQPPDDPDWRKWCSDAAKAHTLLLQVHASGKPISIRQSLYKRSRDFLDDLWKKCAYCESLMILDQTGDVEHFRPKGSVTDEDDKVVQIEDQPGVKRPHPGYFWLAYHWENLLPSCSKCNRPRRTVDGRLVGKSTRFPVDGSHAWPPGRAALQNEHPLLINPLTEDPKEHLDIDIDTGVMFHKSLRGAACIRILDLNREGLPEARRNVYYDVLLRAKDFHAALLDSESKRSQLALSYLEGHRNGHAAYSFVGRKALDVYKEVLRKQGALL